MAFRGFRLQCVLRVLALAAALAALFWLLLRTSLVVMPILAAGAAAAAFISLIRFVELSARRMTDFLESLRHADSAADSPTFPTGREFDGLASAFRGVLDDYRRARHEREEQYHAVASALASVGVGLLVFRGNGTVEIANHAARRLLGVGNIESLDRLGERDPGAAAAIRGLSDGERRLLRLGPEGAATVSAFASRFASGGMERTVVSLQDIREELAENELDAWHKMVRVLTHEIMNSITPISSLASTAARLLRGPADPGAAADAADAVSVIEKRSAGLLSFVERYRALTRLPRPVYARVRVAEAFQRVRGLMGPRILEGGVDFAASATPGDVSVLADPDQLDTVLINVVKNALEAVEGRREPRVRVTARWEQSGAVVVEVADNGTGMDAETADKAFIPFFTTRPDGSGIGLSLSREIVRLHRGAISLTSAAGVGTTVRVTLPPADGAPG
jgi:two-component system, NtrC family, nitrogen regulation sensor histidine kinase NtrY